MGAPELYPSGTGEPIRPPPQAYRWSASMQGTRLEVKQLWNHRHCPPGAPRGRCGLYTPASRWRLLQRFATVNWDIHDGILLITLTYPDSIGHVPYEKRTTQRNLFHRYVEKYLGGPTAMVWRVEHVERKSGWREGDLMPHIHLLVFSRTRIPWQLVREWWGKLLHYEGPLATDIRRIQGAGRAAAYAAKYAAKGSSSSLDIAAYLDSPVIGRAWGIRREKLIATHERIEIETLSEAEVLRVRALLDLASGTDRRYQGGSYTVLGKLAQLGYEALCEGMDADVGGD